VSARRARPDVFAPDSPFGIHLRHDVPHIQMAQELGFKWARLFGMSWSKVEDVPGQWDWSALDPIVKRYHDRKFSLLGVLGDVPRRASTLPKISVAGTGALLSSSRKT
jgi:hypothetical protein